MAEEEEKRDLAAKVARFLPSIVKPTYKQTFNTRLKWTFFALVMYLVLSYVSVFGVVKGSNYQQFLYLEIVMGSRFGSLMTLGIGPIVTGGIILQLLVGSKIINWDMGKPEGRKKFQTWNKLLSVVMCFVEAIFFALVGLPTTGGLGIVIFVMLQLALGGIIVILLDDIVSKWGFGSGISLFIAVGVASQIVIRVLSPLTLACVPGNILGCLPTAGNQPSGLFWGFLSNIFIGNNYEAFTSLLPMLTTALVFILVIFMQDVRIDMPLSFSAMRGFGRTWSLKLFYTSNMPVILAAALIANFQVMGHVGATVNSIGQSCNFLACYDQQGNVVSGAIYYLSSPKNLLGDLISGVLTSSETTRAFTYLIFLSVLSMIFSIFWVSTSGMDAGSVAGQLEDIGMQIPGYRADKKTMEGVLNRYIPSLAVLGGLLIGVLAAFADFTGAIGTGTGILLTVMIIYNYYEELSAQPLEEAHPLIRKILE
jgi:preprotein translocase subunit SecY